MKRTRDRRLLACGLLAALLGATGKGRAELKAGAARVDITPAMADLPKPFTAVDSRLYARTLVLESDGARVVLVVGDLPTIVPGVFNDLVRRLAEAAGTPADHVLLAVTHTHNAVRLDRAAGGILLPGSATVATMTGDRMVESVRQAVAALRPARAGYATGPFHLAAGAGPEDAGQAGASDAAERQIGVLKVVSAGGEPIALVVNNGPEPVMMMGTLSRISADVAGTTERYLEQRFADKVVVLYTVGSPPRTVVTDPPAVEGATPADPHVLMEAVGTLLGEDALRIYARTPTSPELPLRASTQVLSCPGKTTTPIHNAASCSDAAGSTLPRCVFTDHEAAPVDLRISVVRMGELAIVGTDANIDAAVWGEVRERAPRGEKTMLIAQIFGPMHYVEPDAAYPSNSYAVTVTTAKSGCAEKGFVADTLSMLEGSGPKGSR